MAQTTFSFLETMDGVLETISLNGGWSIPDPDLAEKYDHVPSTEWPEDVVEMAVRHEHFDDTKPGHIFTGNPKGYIADTMIDMIRTYLPGYSGSISAAGSGEFVPDTGVYWTISIYGLMATEEEILDALDSIGVDIDESTLVVDYDE